MMTVKTHILCVQVETHSGGGWEWRCVSSYQVEDDLHGDETHVHGFVWNSVWSVYLLVFPSWDDHISGRREQCGPWRALIIQDTSPEVHLTQTPLDKVSTCQQGTKDCWELLAWLNIQNSVLCPSSNDPWVLEATERRKRRSAGSHNSHSSKPMATVHCLEVLRTTQ